MSRARQVPRARQCLEIDAKRLLVVERFEMAHSILPIDGPSAVLRGPATVSNALVLRTAFVLRFPTFAPSVNRGTTRIFEVSVLRTA